MAEFTVNRNKLRDAAASIKNQNRVLEHADEVIGEVEHRLAIEGETKDRLRMALCKARSQVEIDRNQIEAIGTTLQEIEEAYGITETGLRERVETTRKTLGIIESITGIHILPEIVSVLYGAPPRPKIDWPVPVKPESEWGLGNLSECLTMMIYAAPKWNPRFSDFDFNEIFTTLKNTRTYYA